jgi:uncharacterized OB-fold protein
MDAQKGFIVARLFCLQSLASKAVPMKNDGENAVRGRQIVRCEECGAIHVGRPNKDGSFFFPGKGGCPSCGSGEFTEITLSELGLG